MSKHHIILAGQSQRSFANKLIDAAKDGYHVIISEPNRSLAQNAMLHALIADIQAQVPETATFSADDMKLRFLHALGQEMRFLPELEGAGMFPVGQRSSTLSKSQFTGLIELLFQYGAKHGVRWSDKSQRTIDLNVK
jgi:hypothetical protein